MLLGCTDAADSAIIGNILDSMSDSLLVLGGDGEILYANRITERVLGYGMEDFRRKSLSELFFETNENKEFRQIFLDALWRKDIKNYREVDYKHPDGSMRRLAVTTSYLLGPGEQDHSFIGFVALFKDVTEVFQLRRLEHDLTKERERIAHEKISSLQKLAMGVAHEIRNPIVTIGGFAGRILKNQENSEETKRYAQNILEDARRLEAVVREVQAYCDMTEPRPTVGSVSSVVAAVVEQLTPEAAKRNIRLEFLDTIPKTHVVMFDPVMLKDAILRVIQNAMDFSEDGETVNISVTLAEEGIVVQVRDHGAGIKPEDKDFIFNPFFSTKTQASGMGLAVVERVVTEHMGRIDVESELGAGATVRIVLPHTLNPTVQATPPAGLTPVS